MSSPDPRIQQLAGAAKALAQRLGYDVGVKLMAEFGGLQISVPKRPLAKSRLYQTLGRDAAKVLSELYGPSTIDVPVASRLARLARNRAIAEAEGSHGDVARRFGCTRRWVKMVRATHRPAQGGKKERPPLLALLD